MKHRSQFIRLYLFDSTPKRVHLCIDHIVMIGPCRQSTGASPGWPDNITPIRLPGADEILVVETPEEILQLIEHANLS